MSISIRSNPQLCNDFTTTLQHWFSLAPSINHCFYQWWPSLLTAICIIRSRWFIPFSVFAVHQIFPLNWAMMVSWKKHVRYIDSFIHVLLFSQGYTWVHNWITIWIHASISGRGSRKKPCLYIASYLGADGLATLRARASSQYKDGLSGYGISIIKIKRLLDRLIFFMVFSILVRRHLNIETSPWTMFVHWYLSFMEYFSFHNSDVIMSAMASQITDVPSVYLTVYLGADHRKHQSSASLRRSEKTSKLRVTAQIRENIKAPRHWPFSREFTHGR